MREQGLSQPLWLSLGYLLELGELSYLIWERTTRAICWYKNLDSGPTDRLFLNVFLRCAGVCQNPSTFGSITLQPLVADQATIWQMKGDILSYHMRFERWISIHRLHRKINFCRLSFFSLVLFPFWPGCNWGYGEHLWGSVLNLKWGDCWIWHPARTWRNWGMLYNDCFLHKYDLNVPFLARM